MVPSDDGKQRERQPEIPVAVDQAWFWTEHWQHREREADQDVAAHRRATFDTVDAFLADLDAPLSVAPVLRPRPSRRR